MDPKEYPGRTTDPARVTKHMATKGHIRREIVISQATGMVLRDVIFGE